jgi:hypothetical protein
VKHFSPHTLLARLEQGLSVLSGGARDLPARQQTLRGAIAWSYDLLSPEEQKLSRYLAVFVDGWSLEAAEATEQGRWMTRLEQEHENLRAALFWLLAQARGGRERSKQQAEQALRFCTALFWSIRGYSREGQHFLEQALALGENVSVPVRAKAFYTAANLAFHLDDLERTEKLGSESLHLSLELGDKVGMADALWLLGTNEAA